MKVKASKIASMQYLPPYTMIVNEGIKTEPDEIPEILEEPVWLPVPACI